MYFKGERTYAILLRDELKKCPPKYTPYCVECIGEKVTELLGDEVHKEPISATMQAAGYKWLDGMKSLGDMLTTRQTGPKAQRMTRNARRCLDSVARIVKTFKNEVVQRIYSELAYAARKVLKSAMQQVRNEESGGKEVNWMNKKHGKHLRQKNRQRQTNEGG